jgi:hypothetical protein
VDCLDSLLDRHTDSDTSERFVRELARHTCYPPSTLKDGDCKPDSPCLSEDKISQLSRDDLEQIASAVVNHEMYLSRKLVWEKTRNDKGESVCTSKYAETDHPRGNDENIVDYLYRLWLLYREKREKEHKRVIASLMPHSHLSSYVADSIRATLCLGDSLRRTMEETTWHDDIAAAMRRTRLLSEELARVSRPPDSVTREFTRMRALSEGLTSSYRSIQEVVTAMQQERRSWTEWGRSSRLLDDVAKGIAHIRALSESMTTPCLAMREAMRSQSAVFEGLSARVAMLNVADFGIPRFAEAALAWNVTLTGLSNRMNEIGLSAKRGMLSARLFEVPNAYTAFVQHTTERLTTNLSADIAASTAFHKFQD